MLSLQHIVKLASQELVFIGEEQLLPIRGDSSWKYYHDKLMEVRRDFSESADLLGKLIKSTNHLTQLVLSAALDITCGRLGDEEIVDRYSQKGHAGVAFILRMQNLNSQSNEIDVKNMLESREDFLSDVAEMLKHELDNELNFIFTGTQLFIPRHLFANEIVVQAIQRDGRRDILGRSVNHMLHDSNVVLDHAFVPRADGEDFLGRSSLHIACSMSLQSQCSRKEDWASVVWPGDEMLGLDALDIAAIRGHVQAFRTAYSSDFDVLGNMLYQKAGRRRTYIQWAACNGHDNVVLFLLEIAANSKTPLESLLITAERDDKTALSLAARRGHCNVVASLLAYAEVLSLPGDCFARAFIEAVQGRHLNVMKLLELGTDLDFDLNDKYPTPLMETARIGFTDGARFLLSRAIDVNISYGYKEKHNTTYTWKTALDFAIQCGHDDLVELLEEHGAKCREELIQEMDEGETSEEDVSQSG